MVICEFCNREVWVYKIMKKQKKIICGDCKKKYYSFSNDVNVYICSCCKKWRKIFYRDYYGMSSKYPLYQLCFNCLRKHMPDVIFELVKEIDRADYKICLKCKVPFLIQEGKEWAKICLDCWIADKNKDKIELIESVDYFNLTDYQNLCMQTLDTFSNNELNLLVCHMKKEDNKVSSDYEELYQFYNPKFNMRRNFNSEIDIEVEGEDRNENFTATALTCYNLINFNVEYSVWYADGMRTPHIRIFDVEELEKVTAKLRRKIREVFVKKFVPLQYHALIDTTLLSNHKVCLEYAPHWKYNTILKKLFDNKLEVIKCKV